MQDLQEVTHDLHYENYRATRLQDGSDSDGQGKPMTVYIIGWLYSVLFRNVLQTIAPIGVYRHRHEAPRKRG